jgi:hypothetical protein
MIGCLTYPDGLQKLATLCTVLKDKKIPFQLHYIGTREMRDLLSKDLPIHYHGVLSDRERDLVLSSMHLAFLPGPDGDPDSDDFARFSFPSRLLDYFWHGIPVVGPLSDASATYQMLLDLQGSGVWFSKNTADLSETVVKLATRKCEWEIASRSVRDYAERQPPLGHISDLILAAFK